MTPAKVFLGTSGMAAPGGLTGAIIGVFISVEPCTALLTLPTAHGRVGTLRHASLLATRALGYLSFLFRESQKNP